MTYFDATLEAEPVAEQNNDPIIPEDRFVFELIGFERSAPDVWHKNGGIKWTFLVFYEDGRTPFMFNDEQYTLWRTTNINKDGKPLFTLGTQAHEWASALLGRQLGVDEHFSVSELRGKRMSSMVVWQPKKTKPKEKAATLASLRHVSVAPIGTPPATPKPKPAPTQVSADATGDDIDRALIVTKLQKQATRLAALDDEAGKAAQNAIAASELDTAPLADLQSLTDAITAQIVAAAAAD